MSKTAVPASTQQGVILIEAMIAILIFSIGILALVGLQATMVKNTTESKYRSDASNIAHARIGQMWADVDNAVGYVETDTDISNLLPAGKRTVAVISAGYYQVTVKWTQPGEGSVERTFTTTARVSGS